MSQTNPPVDPASTDPVESDATVPAETAAAGGTAAVGGLSMTANAANSPGPLVAEEGGGGSSNG